MQRRFQWPSQRPLIMGVLNVTPDSFSDGGQFVSTADALAQAHALIDAGADLLDIGGESTRPGAATVSVEEECRRVVPVIESLARSDPAVVISVDTTKAEVAARSLEAGARIVNDISAMRFDANMAAVVHKAGAGLVLMHMQGTPATMQADPVYHDVVTDVYDFLAERIAAARSAGIDQDQIAVDPGIGFGKTVEHNLQLLAHVDRFQALGCPVLVGTSRKSFIGRVLDRPEPADRLWGTAATVAWAVAHGADIVRVHDVAAMRDVARMIAALNRARAGDAEQVDASIKHELE